MTVERIMVLLKPMDTVTQGGSVHQCPSQEGGQDDLDESRFVVMDADGKEMIEREQIKIPER